MGLGLTAAFLCSEGLYGLKPGSQLGSGDHRFAPLGWEPGARVVEPIDRIIGKERFPLGVLVLPLGEAKQRAQHTHRGVGA
jgi:hypothetical protein